MLKICGNYSLTIAAKPFNECRQKLLWPCKRTVTKTYLTSEFIRDTYKINNVSIRFEFVQYFVGYRDDKLYMFCFCIAINQHYTRLTNACKNNTLYEIMLNNN